MLVKLVVRTPRKLAETVSALLFEAGAGGVEEQDGGTRLLVYAADRDAAEGIAARTRELLSDLLDQPGSGKVALGASGIALSIEVDESSDWASAWTRHLGQIALTPRLVIQPLWDETPAPPGARRILFDPQLSFGDGAHATTRLASAALERACQLHQEASVLDFGSGTGVLAFVALLSGARHARGIDIDPVSVAAAERNASLNGLLPRCQFSLPTSLETHFDLVVANLEAPALLSVAEELRNYARGSKRLILTGFLADRQAEVTAAFGATWKLAHAEYEEAWALLELLPLV